MPDLEFIKLKTYMFDDEKIRIIESMPDADSLLVIWVKLLCQAGKTYAGGYICITENIQYTEEELASVLSRPINTVRLAINTFKRLNMIELDGSGIYIKNFPKHQNIEAMEAAKERNRLKVAKYRESQRLLTPGNGNVTVTTPNVTQQNKSKTIDKELRTKSIYTVWNEQKIIVHKKLTPEIEQSIKSTLKEYSLEDITQAIQNYAEIQKGEQYYFKYAWTLKDFLKRGLSKFLNAEIARQNYKKDGKGDKKNPRALPAKYTRPEDL